MAFAFLLIKRYKGLESRKWLVPLFATAYALSGMLVSYQMNVIFYDAMIMLPIVIVYLEELLDGGAPLPLCLCLRLDRLAPILYGLYDLHFHRLVCLLLCITKADGRRRLEEEN